MPLYESSLLTQEQMQQHAKNHKCQCGGTLLVAWSADHNCYMLRCADHLEHSDFIRPANISNYDLPGYNMPGVIRRQEKMMMQKYGEEKTKQMVRIGGGNPIATLTQEGAKQILVALYPLAATTKAGQSAIIKAALICRDYGLNPAMDHVFLIPFGQTWTVVRGIKASRLICAREKSYGYIDDTPRIMTKEEQERIFGEIDNASVVAICKLKDKDGNTFTGYGKWPKATAVKGTEKGNSQFNMACIRAERQALDKMNPGAMPADVDVVDERYMESHRVTVEEIKPEVQQIPESATPEAEGQAEEVSTEGEQQTEADKEFDKLESAGSTAVKKYKAPAEVKSFGDLYKTCMEQWPETFKTKTDVLKEVGVSRQEDLSQTPAEIYSTILSMRK